MEKNNCLRCNFRHTDNGNCTAVGGSCTAVQATHCPLLRKYLDTGLTPERCAEFARADAEGRYIVMRDAEQEGVARLRELAVADKDGRVIVLPCKVGDILWITGSIRRLYSAKVRTFFIGHPSGVRGGDNDGGIQMIRTTECDVPMRDFGRTVFLTREEAEKALAELEGKKDD